MNSLLELIQCGQSYWLDNLTREMIQSGALKKRIVEEGLRGITSNPAIFNKAISRSSDYDAQIKELASGEMPVESIYEQLVIKDIQDACDLLRPVYDESQRLDGFGGVEAITGFGAAVRPQQPLRLIIAQRRGSHPDLPR